MILPGSFKLKTLKAPLPFKRSVSVKVFESLLKDVDAVLMDFTPFTGTFSPIIPETPERVSVSVVASFEMLAV